MEVAKTFNIITQDGVCKRINKIRLDKLFNELSSNEIFTILNLKFQTPDSEFDIEYDVNLNLLTSRFESKDDISIEITDEFNRYIINKDKSKLKDVICLDFYDREIDIFQLIDKMIDNPVVTNTGKKTIIDIRILIRLQLYKHEDNGNNILNMFDFEDPSQK